MRNEDRTFYRRVLRETVDDLERLMGEKVTLQQARKTPLEIDAEGEIVDYYGSGKTVLSLLVGRFEEVLGEEAAEHKIRKTMSRVVDEADYDKLPESIRPDRQDEEQHSWFDRFF
jgi:hypothetical protein